MPVVTFSLFMAMLAATIGSILESIGDYYAVARSCGEPDPPKHAINRGIAMEGLGSFICGLLGAGHATTSYSSPTALIPITGVSYFNLVESELLLSCSAIMLKSYNPYNPSATDAIN